MFSKPTCESWSAEQCITEHNLGTNQPTDAESENAGWPWLIRLIRGMNTFCYASVRPLLLPNSNTMDFLCCSDVIFHRRLRSKLARNNPPTFLLLPDDLACQPKIETLPLMDAWLPLIPPIHSVLDGVDVQGAYAKRCTDFPKYLHILFWDISKL